MTGPGEGNDEMLQADAYQRELVNRPATQLELIPETTHLGVVFDPNVHRLIGDWLKYA